jgi:hypothetical protein
MHIQSKNSRRLFSWFVICFLPMSLEINAAHAAPLIDDSDISGSEASFLQSIRPLQSLAAPLQPDETRRTSLESGLELSVQIQMSHGELRPVSNLLLFASDIELRTDENGVARLAECAPRSQFRFQSELRDSHFSVGDGSTPYRLQMAVDCGVRVEMIFREESNSGQPLGIWNVATAGKTKLASTVGLAFWSRPVTFVWPANGDYYSGGRVNLTRGDHWDVVGHEMGHAIYDLGRLGGFGGGSHKIDECYTEALALSEGWASYFSAWVQIPLDDPDARFPYLVPRRAPIRFENIPNDVCSGPTNEWRVTGFLWDLIDLNDDGETLEAGFAQLWMALQGSRTPGARSASQLFERAGIPRETLNRIWELNFQTVRP